MPEGAGARGGYADGIRAGLPFLLPALILGASFGVLAEPLMGPVAPVVMSTIVFAGSAQFTALSVLLAGGGAGAAITGGLLMNARFLPMGVAIAGILRGGPARRAAEGQLLTDASFALASRGDGRFDREVLIGATIPQGAGWVGGTAIGVVAGAALADPGQFGIDAIFPAFYLALLVHEVRGRRALAAALLGGAIALSLMPVAPPGVPVIAAAAASLLGLRSA
jgi:predicted branched-subunit amino acid permease